MEKGFCECGCGTRTRLAPKTDRKIGWIRGEPLRFVKGHQTRGRVYPKNRVDPGPEKKCVKCSLVRPIEEFGRRKDKVDGRESWCRFCQRTLTRDYSLRKKFGITLQEYFDLCEGQEYRCAICQTECRNQRGNRRDVLAVDHCHQSGKIRGLLCMDCNVALGHLRDSPSLLRTAATYIERSSG